MIIAQISDTHLAVETPDADRRIEDFERTIADINALDPAPDVLVHTGDIVHDGQPGSYDQAVTILNKVRMQVCVLAGNKDNRENLRSAFSSHEYLTAESNFITYAIEDFAVRLVSLDTVSLNSNKGDFCVHRAQNLIDMIDADSTKPIAIFAHHPPFEVLVGPEPFNFETQEAMSRFRETVQHSGRVVAVFCGHVHRAAAGHVNGIPATVVPSVATTLRWGDYPDDMRTRPVYFVHRFDPDWGFSTETRIVGNRLMDLRD